MTAFTPKRRDGTAREIGEEYGITARTVRKYIAEPRDEYLVRAKARRQEVVELRLRGHTYAQIAELTGETMNAVNSLLRMARENHELPDLSGVPGIDGRLGIRTARRPRKNKRHRS